MSSSDSSSSSSSLYNAERLLFIIVFMLSTAIFGAHKLSHYYLHTSPFTEALATLSIFSVIGALVGSSLLHFAISLPASGIKLLNLDASWDDSIIVRWAAMLQQAHDTQSQDTGQTGVSTMEIQAALLLVVVGFIGMRLIHHGVVVLRLLKVARRNQHLMLKNPDQKK